MDDKEQILFFKNKNLTNKLNICLYSTLYQQEEYYIKDPIIKLVSNFEEIELIQSLNNADYFKFLYFNRIKIHDILYYYQKNITINEIENKIKNYFYFSLLLQENATNVNYIYSIDLIKQINQLQTKEKKQKIKIIILSKLMSDLIANYESIDENNDENFEDVIKKIKNYNNDEIIDKNIDFLKVFDIGKNDIYGEKIDIIYAKIINYLIVNKKLEESEYTIDIIKQLDLESIYITKTILANLIKILDKNKDYIKEFMISKYEDLFNQKKINFYYFLLKYIIKSNCTIYHIPFLYEIRNTILRIINDNITKFYYIKLYKIEYILNKFNICFKYYIKKSSKLIQDLSNSNNNYSKDNISFGNSDRSRGTSSVNVFERSSVKKEKEENSGRHFDIFEESPKYEFEELVQNCEKEYAFKILQKSCFFIKN